MRGRKPKPSWRKKLDGHPGHHKRNDHEPELPPAAPVADDVPKELRALPLAVEEWRRVSTMLQRARAITEADRAALLALCIEWSRYLEAIGKITASGMVILSPSGYPMPNPYLPIATKALAACARLWPELGMTPSSRSRVQAQPGVDDPFAEFDQPPPALPPSRPQ